MNYGMRHKKLFKSQSVLQDRFFKNFTKFAEIHLCLNLFYDKVASELWQKYMSNVSERTVTDDFF